MNHGIFEADMFCLGSIMSYLDSKPDVPLKSIKYNYPDRGGMADFVIFAVTKSVKTNGIYFIHSILPCGGNLKGR